MKKAHNRLNLVGKRFTRLTVISDAGNHPTTGESYWKCLCDCGGTLRVTGYSLTSGNTKSCGCYHKIRTRELFSKSPEDNALGKVFCDYRKSARVKGHSFELSRKQLEVLIKENCYYCGGNPSNSLVYHEKTIVYQGIDRKDNSEGYTPDNVVPCCIICNKMKKTLSLDEFLSHINKISTMFEVKVF